MGASRSGDRDSEHDDATTTMADGAIVPRRRARRVTGALRMGSLRRRTRPSGAAIRPRRDPVDWSPAPPPWPSRAPCGRRPRSRRRRGADIERLGSPVLDARPRLADRDLSREISARRSRERHSGRSHQRRWRFRARPRDRHAQHQPSGTVSMARRDGPEPRLLKGSRASLAVRVSTRRPQLRPRPPPRRRAVACPEGPPPREPDAETQQVSRLGVAACDQDAREPARETPVQVLVHAVSLSVATRHEQTLA